jgi:ferredoxin-NADP reductase
MPNLEVVHVLRDPPPGWTGETGRVTAELLNRHLPRHYESFEYFVCAGEAMMDTVEQSLLEIGVPGYRIHTERFAMV